VINEEVSTVLTEPTTGYVLGADAYLIKPFKTTVLLNTLGHLLASQQGHSLTAQQTRGILGGSRGGGAPTFNINLTINNPMRNAADTARIVDELEREIALRYRLQTSGYTDM
jgi:DNA-binding response OmpR family regulator